MTKYYNATTNRKEEADGHKPSVLSDLLGCQKDAERYRWLRSKFAEGDETYIGEWLTSEDDLDKYIDEKMAT